MMLYDELLKFIRQKQVLIGAASAFLFSILGFMFHFGKPGESAFALPVSALGNLTQTYFILFPTAFTGFILSQEHSNRTVRIIRSRGVQVLRLMAAKFAAAAIYSSMLFALVFLVNTVLGILFFPRIDFTVDFGWFREKGFGAIPAGEAVPVLLRAYAVQAAANIYLVSLVFVCTAVTGSSIFGFGGSLIVTVMEILASNVDAVEPFLPKAHLLPWRLMMTTSPDFTAAFSDLAVLWGYSLIMFIVSIIVYRYGEVRE